MNFQEQATQTTSAERLLKRVAACLVGMVFLVMAGVASASQVVGEVTLTIGKSKIEYSIYLFACKNNVIQFCPQIIQLIPHTPCGIHHKGNVYSLRLIAVYS